MRTRNRRTVVLSTALLSALWLLPLVLAAQVEEARARIDGIV